MFWRRRPPADNQPPRQPMDIQVGASENLNVPQTLQQAHEALSKNNWPEAERLGRLVIDRHKDHYGALNLLGAIAVQSQRLPDAAAWFERAVAANSSDASAHANLGIVLQNLGRLSEAIACFERSLRIHPHSTGVCICRGNALKEMHRLNEALESYDRALKIEPDCLEAHNNRGVTLQALEQFDEALKSYDHALKIKPDYGEVHYNRGITLSELNRLDEAVISYDRALSIHPDDGDALFNRGIALGKLKRSAEALTSYERAVSIRPSHAEAHYNRGAILQELNRQSESLDCYRLALRIKPDYADAHWNMGICCLQLGDFARGWKGYEWGWENKKRGKAKSSLVREWNGSRLAGSLLVLPEQGIGDEIFYSGMLNDLKNYADSITVCVDPRLVTLYQRSFAHISVVPKSAPLEARSYDAQIHMGSLGRFFRADEQSMKRIKVPYLTALPERVQQLRRRIRCNGKLTCGLSWISKNADIGADKSLHLQNLKSILTLPSIDFVNLQYGDTTEEQATLWNKCGLTLKNVPDVDNFSDIDGLATLIEACDVVVTVSNTTAHLAAALGKRVYLMLPFSTGLLWYWHVNRTSTPWYPTVKLFRQPAMGDWSSVIDQVRQELTRL